MSRFKKREYELWVHPDKDRPILTVTGLIHPNEVPEGYQKTDTVTINEEWTAIDRWWTEFPIVRKFRDVTRNGVKLVEVREEPDGTWNPVCEYG